MKLVQHISVLLIALLIGCQLFAQSSSKENNSESNDEESFTPTPTIGIGGGFLTFYGDYSKGIKSNNAVTSRLAFDLHVEQKINSFLSVRFNYMRGKVSANERDFNTNRNFESTINAGGISVLYNFDHLLGENRVVEPYIGAGIAYLDFDSKTDLIDEYGNTYHYWSDGTIRNLSEGDPNADELSVRLARDYEYETDLRKLYEEELGDYEQFTVAFPVSVGVNMILAPKWNFKMGATYYFTLSDYIDGYTPDNSPEGSADGQNDNMLYVGASLGYNFSRNKKEELPVDDTPFLFAANEDEDGDGINDFIDQCPFTPVGVQVDDFGCPLDGDDDEVGNFKDDELNSAPGAIVDSVGVTYSDERLLEMYLAYMDTTGAYSKIEKESYTIDIVGGRTKRNRDSRKTVYAVKIASFQDAIPSEMVTNMLNYKDVQTLEQDNQIVLAVGKFPSIAAATEQREALSAAGVSSESIIAIDPDGNIRNVDSRPSFVSEEGVTHFDESNMADQEVVYRVQLGAFKKKANEKAFKGFDNVMAVSSADGYTRYYSAPYNSYSQAAAIKINAVQSGFPEAYVVAIKGGTKVDIRSVKQGGTSGISNLPEGVSLSDEQKQYLRFKVQLGSYKKQVPTDVMESYLEFSDLQRVVGADGVTRYVVGDFSSYQEANQYKQELRSEGFGGCFVVGEFQGEIVPAKKAIELSK